ncbi:uncharacterized protein C11orf71 homolog [Rousettus aegyptiacus]|uniref:Uncharacterized protein n=1 Tax=Rousettus aegyptiacus TaxID=9407 RepID=A0A7J8GX08_ROUAE|nr:uncharacterized protein C11orf71 homolog [Rousettus aegyptiacus]KAF6464185.1 hypothetical protein HJG63_001661 [Rousettus aegyptiacus]
MVLNHVSMSAGDQGNGVAYRSTRGDHSPSALALVMVSGDSFLVTRPEAVLPGPTLREAVRPSIRTENRRAAAGAWGPTRFIKGRDLDGRNRRRQSRFSPYPTPGVKLDILRSVLQQRLIAFGGVIAAGGLSS